MPTPVPSRPPRPRPSRPRPSRPRRSALYLPATYSRALAKARTLDCDTVVIDLEDSVAPEAKAQAREQAVAALQAGGFGQREVVVRVNGLDTPWGDDDLAALVRTPPDAVLVPKVTDAGDVARYDARLTEAPAPTRLWAMIETCRCLFHLDAIGGMATSTRLAGLVLGLNDLAKEMGATLDARRAPVQAAMTLSVAAGRAHGITVLDGVFNALDDLDGLELQCRQAKAFGFDGKTLIHPRQIETCNRVFDPSPEEIAAARRIVAAFAAPQSAGLGALRVDGAMVERLHLAQAERMLAAAGQTL